MRIVAFITETAPCGGFSTTSASPPTCEQAAPDRPRTRAPAWNDPPVAAMPDWEALAQPSPEYVFDQEVPW